MLPKTLFTPNDTAHRHGVLALVLVVASLVAFTRPAMTSAAAQGNGCALPPVALPLFNATPAAAIAASPAPTAGLTARPLTDDEQAEAEDAIRTIVACINTGIPKDEYAIFTPRYLAALFTGPHPAYQPAFEQMIAEGGTNQSTTVPAFVLKSVSNGSMLEDGRIVVTIALAGRATTYHDTLVLVNTGKHWLIDEVTRLDPPLATPPAA